MKWVSPGGTTRGKSSTATGRVLYNAGRPSRRTRPRGRSTLLARIRSLALHGLDSIPVLVEVSITNGLPAFHVVGLPDAAVRESRVRVVSALRESGFQFPMRRITVNLAPAHQRKEGSTFDLPIALAVLAASGQLPAQRMEDWIVVGELALDGTLRPTRGAMALAEGARREGATAIVVPAANGGEAALASALPVFAAESLLEVTGWVRGNAVPRAVDVDAAPQPTSAAAGDDSPLDAIAGQEHAKRALEVAAAGGHNLLFIGPPGVGKTLLARALPAILPPLSPAEAIERARIASVAGQFNGDAAALLSHRPFRAPHASISPSALLGGGPVPRPGEITLAHHGVLFLDELPEFRRDVLEALRLPLEEGSITVARGTTSVRFPATFQLVAAMNPCPCGFLGSGRRRACRCRPDAIRRYRGRLSGPLLDRIDLRIEVPAMRARDLARRRLALFPDETAGARDRVRLARARQEARSSCLGVAATNARLTPAELERAAALDNATRRLLADAVTKLGLSARGYHRAWRLARTVADLAGETVVGAEAVAEALSMRGEG